LKDCFSFEIENELATTSLPQSMVWLFQTILLLQNDIFKASFFLGPFKDNNTRNKIIILIKLV
jgi:hypothetical protein